MLAVPLTAWSIIRGTGAVVYAGAGMEFQRWIGPLALLIAVVGVYYQRRQTRMMESQATEALARAARRRGETIRIHWWKTPAIPVLLVLVILAWMPYFLKIEDPIIVKDVHWGAYHMDPTGQKLILQLSADFGQLLGRFGSEYRIMALAAHFSGNIDPNDAI
jgi:hypothetical protein